MTDANGIIHQALFDPLGMVIATSIFKEAKNSYPREGDGDLSQFNIRTDATFEKVLADPAGYLGEATSFFYYDLLAWQERQQPANYISLVQQTHVSDLEPGKPPVIQISMGYSDGFGREIESKLAVEPGEAVLRDSSGTLQRDESHQPVQAAVAERWLVSGRTVYNNKGKPAEQYLPYFSNTAYYETQQEIVDEKLVPPPTVIYYDPLLREIRIDTPKGFFSKVEFTPWESKHYDLNDTVKDSTYYQQFIANYPANPTEEQKNEKDALTKAAVFYDTPGITVLDSLGNAFLNIENLGTVGLTSYHKYDIQGREIESIDPRLYYSNLTQGIAYYNFKYQYPMGSDGKNPASTDSADAGLNLSLNNIFGSFLWNRSPRNFDQVIDYDRFQRKTQIRVKGFKEDGTIATDNIVETFTYGESQSQPEIYNLRGQLYQHQDQSGQIINRKYSIHGQLLETTRQFTQEYKDYINWETSVKPPVLETDKYLKQYSFNALQQVITETTPDGSVTTNSYNRGGLLEQVSVKFKDGNSQAIINDISYNANRQRTTISYANGVNTTYTYEDTTLHLIHLYSTRPGKDAQGNDCQTVIQDISYTYDPVGNITRTYDKTYDTVFYNNQKVEPLSDYTYDALYRLIKSNGRQHRGINAGTYRNNEKDRDFKQSKYIPLSDSNALENYQETYTYDEAGNLIKTTHTASNPWMRTQEIRPDSNRLKTIQSSNGLNYSQDVNYDNSGNMKQLYINSAVNLTWNCCDNLIKVGIIERPDELDDCDYYTYDGNEMRTRKVSERMTNGGAVVWKEGHDHRLGQNRCSLDGAELAKCNPGSSGRKDDHGRKEEIKYLGKYEVKFIRNEIQNGETTVLIRNTLRVMDDKTCVAIVHYCEQDDSQREVDKAGTRSLRYQLGNNLGSVSLEVDEDAQIISYEEYFPYGGTAFIAGRNQQEVRLKEYRYSGKERDDSAGLYYYGARYYAPWLGRWISPDPAGTVDGLNLYGFVGGNPLVHVDVDGKTKKKKKKNEDEDEEYVDPSEMAVDRRGWAVGATPTKESKTTGQEILKRWESKSSKSSPKDRKKAVYTGTAKGDAKYKDTQNWKIMIREKPGGPRIYVPLKATYKDRHGKDIPAIHMGHKLAAARYWEEGATKFAKKKPKYNLRYSKFMDAGYSHGRTSGRIPPIIREFMNYSPNYRFESGPLNSSAGSGGFTFTTAPKGCNWPKKKK